MEKAVSLASRTTYPHGHAWEASDGVVLDDRLGPRDAEGVLLLPSEEETEVPLAWNGTARESRAPAAILHAEERIPTA
jgi:hypothetical protein